MGNTANLVLPYPEDTDPLANMAAAIEALAQALDSGLGGGWVAYTPAWTAVTTNPTLGNGTILGRYRKIGKHVHFRVQIVAGTTTTGGSGNYSVSLPFTSHASGRQVVLGDVVYSGGPIIMRGRIEASGSTVALWVPGGTAGSYERGATGAIPAGISNGVTWVVEGFYEAA